MLLWFTVKVSRNRYTVSMWSRGGGQRQERAIPREGGDTDRRRDESEEGETQEKRGVHNSRGNQRKGRHTKGRGRH